MKSKYLNISVNRAAVIAEAERQVEEDKVYQYRFGQAVFNILLNDDYMRKSIVFSDMAGSEVDPFYHDERVTKFLDEIDRRLNEIE
jgi:hypothetical protein